MGLKLVTDEKNVKVRVFDKTSAAGNSTIRRRAVIRESV